MGLYMKRIDLKALVVSMRLVLVNQSQIIASAADADGNEGGITRSMSIAKVLSWSSNIIALYQLKYSIRKLDNLLLHLSSYPNIAVDTKSLKICLYELHMLTGYMKKLLLVLRKKMLSDLSCDGSIAEVSREHDRTGDYDVRGSFHMNLSGLSVRLAIDKMDDLTRRCSQYMARPVHEFNIYDFIHGIEDYQSCMNQSLLYYGHTSCYYSRCNMASRWKNLRIKKKSIVM